MEERRNILFGEIIVFDGNKNKSVKNAVWTEGKDEYKKMKIVEVISFKIVGQTNPLKSYTEVKASDEKRNNITGAYE